MLHTNRLIGLVGKEMPAYGLMKPEVKIGDFIAEDELVIADDLIPEIHFRLEFVVENKCSLDVVERNFADLKKTVLQSKYRCRLAASSFFHRKTISLSLKQYPVLAQYSVSVLQNKRNVRAKG